MKARYSYRKANISFKKIKRKISSFKNCKLEEIFLNTSVKFDKSDFILNKLLKSSIYDLKKRFGENFTIKKYELFANKSKIYKKPIYRAKGRINIIKKRSSNIFLFVTFIQDKNGE
ncbi:50S ribosomal subunit protein L22 [Candidatus Vidania fulgoroideae]|nr:50S ribosomal subunit protein L22 [Candidatus Vidania fulgoroideae]